MHQQRSQVSIAPLADAQLPDSSTSAGLARDKSDPCCKLPGILERGRRAHAGDNGRCCEQTDAWDLGDSFAGR